MNLWEVTAALFVFVVFLPVFALSETNATTALALANQATDEYLALTSATDEFLSGGLMSAVITEGQHAFHISQSKENAGVCPGVALEITTATDTAQVSVPQCDWRLFTT